MCETCLGYLRDASGYGDENLLWVIEDQGQWLRSNKFVDLRNFCERWQFTRQTIHDGVSIPTLKGKQTILWRCENLKCDLVLNMRASWKGSDIYIRGRGKAWKKKKGQINEFVKKYVQAHCFSCSFGHELSDAEKRLDPADKKPYTYEELAAWYARMYSEAEILVYWEGCYEVVDDGAPPPPPPPASRTKQPTPRIKRPMPSLPRWCPQAQKHIVPEFRPEDAALWEELNFNHEGASVEFPEYMSRGLIAALQMPWDLKYGGDGGKYECKVIKNGWVPGLNERMWSLIVDSNKAVETRRRMGCSVVKEANRNGVSGIMESALACFCKAEDRGTDFRCDPWHLDLLSRAFHDACTHELWYIHPQVSQAFQKLVERTYFPPMRADGRNDAWPIGLSATAELTSLDTLPSCSSCSPMQ